MNLGQYLLRILFPEDEQHRMELRKLIACSEAHTQDLQRTLITDAEAIRSAVERFRRDERPNG